MDYARGAYRAATSKTAQRTALNAVLVTTACTFLYGLAVLSYALFYYNYLPDQVTTLPVHLQYGAGTHPYGIVSLANSHLRDAQAYDVTISLTIPRSPPNLARGNFMIALHVLGPPSSISVASDSAIKDRIQPDSDPLAPPDLNAVLANRPILHTTARPALIPYADPLASLAGRMFLLGWHVLFPQHASSHILRVPMAERLVLSPSYRRGASSRPAKAILIEIRAGQALQVYRAEVTLAAQLGGLRWFMYQWRVTAFVTLTGMFWACEVGAMVVSWGVLVVLFTGGRRNAEEKGKGVAVKKEDDGLSDTERTFPSVGRQGPLRFEARARTVKHEENAGDGSEKVPGLSSLTPSASMAPGAEADDEEDYLDRDDAGWFDERAGSATEFRDSGIGTSYSEHGGRDKEIMLRRRTSREERGGGH